MTRALIPATVAAALIVAGCGSSSSSSSGTPSGGPYGGGVKAAATTAAAAAASAATTAIQQARTTATNAAKAAVGGAAVTYQNFDANPKTITVKVGQKVTWTNMDSAAHNVTSTAAPSGDKIASDAINPGATFSFTPKTAGTISYVCTFHPQMTGYKVIVTS
jgi:plastocyanin